MVSVDASEYGTLAEGRQVTLFRLAGASGVAAEVIDYGAILVSLPVMALFYALQERLITRYPLMSPAWMNHPVPGKWTTPDVDQAAENMITLGAKALVFVPVGFVTENHETQLDIGYTIDKVKDRVVCEHLPTLNEDPELLRMGAEWIKPLIEELRAG